MPTGIQVPLLDLDRQHRALGPELRDAFERVLASSVFIGGAEVAAFEAEFAAYCGTRHCIGVANGTDALVLTLRALGIGPGDRVLTVPFTFAATVEAIDLVGAVPLFVDITARDYTIDVEAAARVMEREQVKAVIPVHLYGHPADVEPLAAAAARRGVLVVEDAAQAHGARLRVKGTWRRAGSLGAAGCFSFYPTKNLGALGDAGAVTTDDDEVAQRIRALRDHGQGAKYVHDVRGGTNSRLDALQAAVLRVKLGHLGAWTAARRRAAQRYGELLSTAELRPPTEREGAEAVYHQYVVRVARRDLVRERMAAMGVHTSVHYPAPLHLQPAYRMLSGAERFPIAEQCADEVLSLPLFPSITLEEQEATVAALRGALGAP